MTIAQRSPPRPWWKCDRKTLVGAGLLLVVAVVWLTARITITYDERQAATALELLGAQVYYDYQWDSDGRFIQPVGPVWLLRLFGNARAVTGHSSTLTDAHLVHLNALTQLEILDLTNTQVSGTGFRDVDQLTKLKGLYLARTPFNDEGLKTVVRFSGLQDIILSQTPVSDEGIACLKRLRNPHSLRLDGTRCSAEGINKLRQEFPSCQIVP